MVDTFEVIADEERLNADPATRADLEAIADPTDRFVAASGLAAKHGNSAAEIEKLRFIRQQAIAVLHIKLDVPKAEVMRRLGITDRRTPDNALDKWDDRRMPAWDEATAVQKGAAAHAELIERTAAARVAVEVRRVLVLELTGGKYYGREVTNADLARLSGLTTAAISKIRTGNQNSDPAVRRARRHRRRDEARAAAVADLAEVS